jgi:TonB family protein
MADWKYDIDKYVNGELTPAEMHALEEQALRDPFLADALEGASQIKPADLEADLKGLQYMLADRLKSKQGKVVAFWVWPARIAAGLLLLILSTLVVVTLTTRHSPEQDLAVNEQSKPAADSKDQQTSPIQLDSVEKETDNLLSQAKSKEEDTTPAPRVESKAAEVPAASPAVENEAPLATAESRTEDNAKVADDFIVEEKITQVNPQPSAPAGELKKSEAARTSVRKRDDNKESAAGAAAQRSAQDEAINQRIIKGRVVSKEGTGLPGVNVMIKGSTLGTVTDAQGNYQISVSPGAGLVFSFIGYAATELSAGELDQSPVQLNEDVMSLSEVVVVAYGEASGTNETTYEMATPSGGRKAFKQYLEKNLRYPKSALEKKIEGKVTVQFVVEPTGQLSDFKVIKGIGSGCDEEVIRLITQGPSWTPAKKNNDSVKDVVKVRMKFEIPR